MKIILWLTLALDTAFAGQRMPTWDEIQPNSHRPVKPQEPPCDTPEPGTIGLMGAGLIALMVARNWRAR